MAFSRDATAEFARFAEQHRIRPVIGKQFDFEEVIEAFHALLGQKEVGKVVVKTGGV